MRPRERDETGTTQPYLLSGRLGPSTDLPGALPPWLPWAWPWGTASGPPCGVASITCACPHQGNIGSASSVNYTISEFLPTNRLQNPHIPLTCVCDRAQAVSGMSLGGSLTVSVTLGEVPSWVVLK